MQRQLKGELHHLLLPRSQLQAISPSDHLLSHLQNKDVGTYCPIYLLIFLIYEYLNKLCICTNLPTQPLKLLSAPFWWHALVHTDHLPGISSIPFQKPTIIDHFQLQRRHLSLKKFPNLLPLNRVIWSISPLLPWIPTMHFCHSSIDSFFAKLYLILTYQTVSFLRSGTMSYLTLFSRI